MNHRVDQIVADQCRQNFGYPWLCIGAMGDDDGSSMKIASIVPRNSFVREIVRNAVWG